MRALLLALLVGCGGNDETPECVDHGECAEGQLCLSGQCKVVECVSSAVCALGAYCRPEDHTCVEGCEVEADCLPGDTCDVGSKTCKATTCTDTETDCGAGEFCKAETGTCELQAGLCSECSKNADCPAKAECLNGFDRTTSYCFGKCTTDADCPAAFDCVAVIGLNDSVCAADCTFLLDQGIITP